MVSSTLSKALLAAAVGTASVQAVCTFSWTADTGDTCQSLADTWNIGVDQFEQYNPTVKCPTVTPGVSYCVEWDYGAAPTTTPKTTTTSKTSTTTTSKTSTTTTAPAGPSPTQDGLISTCKSFYKVASGDTCGKIQAKYNTFSLADFYTWNPAVGTDCTGLWVDYYVCVGVPGTPTGPATTTKATTTPSGPSPTQDGIASNCANFYKVASGDTCQKIVDKYGGFSLDQFYGWNPAIGTDCSGLWVDYYVCVGVPGTPTTTKNPTTTTAPSGPSPTQDGIISTCKTFYKVASGDTCQKIVDKYGTFALTDFYNWNPAVGSDCSGLWVGYYVCVGLPSTPTTTNRPTTTTKAPSGPSPTQDGIVSTCKTFYKVASGDTCQKIVDKYGTFSLTDFYNWNPAVGRDCSGLWVGYYVCVGLPSTPTTTQRPTTTTKAPSGPTPTQDGIISSCNAWYQAKSGDACQKIVDQYKTFSLSDFYKWNPAVGSNCASLWVGYYYCIGIKR